MSLEDFATLLREAQAERVWTDEEATRWALDHCS